MMSKKLPHFYEIKNLMSSFGLCLVERKNTVFTLFRFSNVDVCGDRIHVFAKKSPHHRGEGFCLAKKPKNF